MQILENVIKHRWGAIDDTQRAGIRNFVSNLIIKLSSDEQLFRQEKVYLNKLNIALVQVSISHSDHLTGCHLQTLRMSLSCLFMFSLNFSILLCKDSMPVNMYGAPKCTTRVMKLMRVRAGLPHTWISCHLM